MISVEKISERMAEDVKVLRELASKGNDAGLILHTAYLKGALQMLEWATLDTADRTVHAEVRELTAFVTRCYLDASLECQRIVAEQRKGIFR